MRFPKRLLSILTGLVLATGAITAPPPPPVAAVDYPCAATFVQIEPQAWWLNRTGEAWPGRHIHEQICWPTGIVTGEFSQNMRVLLHAQPQGAKLTRLRIKDAGAGDKWVCTPGKTGCPSPWPTIDANGDLSFIVNVHFDTSGMSTGIHEMQLAAVVLQPNGAEQFVSSGLPLYVRSMTGGPGATRNYQEARGWYTGFNYDNARTRTALSAFRTITQPFSFVAECAAPSGAPVTGCSAWIDPDAHNGFMGTPLLPLVTGPSKRTATVNGLAPGLHKIVIKTDASGNRSGNDGTNSGLFVITVLVP